MPKPLPRPNPAIGLAAHAAQRGPPHAGPQHFDLKLRDEPARLAALRRCDVMDTPAEAPFEKIVSLVRCVLGVPLVAVPLIDERRQWFKARRGLDCPETPRAVAFCDHTIRSRAPLLVSDARTDPRFADNPLVLGPPFIRSYIGVPLATPDGYNVGALCAMDTVPRVFTPEHTATLATFAQLTQDVLELRQIAARDHLTGALTRRAFTAELAKAIERFQFHDEPASLVVLDLDRFKDINDTHGHSVGDEVLRVVGACCLATLRGVDAFGRLGGEEFGLLLAGAHPHAALATASRLRHAIAASHLDRRPALPVTASFGIAPLRGRSVSVAAWTASADVALYAAKSAGRNCCRVAGDRSAERADLVSQGDRDLPHHPV